MNWQSYIATVMLGHEGIQPTNNLHELMVDSSILAALIKLLLCHLFDHMPPSFTHCNLHLPTQSLLDQIHHRMGLQDLTFIEFFAGVGNCWRTLNRGGEQSAGLDLTYMTVGKGERNPFDILTTSGMVFLGLMDLLCDSNSSTIDNRLNYLKKYHNCICHGIKQDIEFECHSLIIKEFLHAHPRLAIHMILCAKVNAFATLWGIVCSSWVHMNSFTSKRSILLPEGDCSRPYVAAANTMVSRILCCAIFL